MDGPYRLCTGAIATTLITNAFVGAGLAFSHGFGISFSRDPFTSLCASEDSSSLMGGSDVVHCVRMSLTRHNCGTVLGALESGMEIVLYNWNTHSVTLKTWE